MSQPQLAFELRTVRLPLRCILPVRQVGCSDRTAQRYRNILESIRHAAMVEPLVVYPKKDSPGMYVLMDGHLRLLALKDLGKTEADCILATDDESFTYNARVNRLAPIQEHKMIMKAVNNGIAPEKIALKLGLKIEYVQSLMNLLDGLHEEAADLLKDKPITATTIAVLKKVNGVRQIEIAELMNSANNFTTWYAEALLLGTRKSELKNPKALKVKTGISPEDIAKMELEMESLERDLKVLEGSYGDNMFNLTLVSGYLKNLLQNAKVVRFLSSKYADLLSEFEKLAALESV